jgi:hypothetical protein
MGFFSPAEDALKTSDDVIKDAFTIIAAICRALCSPFGIDG